MVLRICYLCDIHHKFFVSMKRCFLMLALALGGLTACEQDVSQQQPDKVVLTRVGDKAEAKPEIGLGADTLRFLAIGDWGRDGDFGQQATADQMAKSAEAFRPQFVVSTGDNFYENGVDSIQDPRWQTSYEQIYHHASLQLPWFAVLGNHDYRKNPDAQVEYSLYSRRWQMDARYFAKTFTFKDGTQALFLFIDTNPFVARYHSEEKYKQVKGQDTTAQLTWIRQALSASQAKWKFVIGHHPVYSASPDHGNTPELIGSLKPLLDQYAVNAYICGHDHDLQHLRKGNVHYFVSGAGSKLREAGKNDVSVFTYSVNGFMQFMATGDELLVQFVDVNGKTIYQTQMQDIAEAMATLR